MPKTVHIDYPKLQGAETLEQILCVSTLTNLMNLYRPVTVQDAKDWYEITGGCDTCMFKDRCLACIINE